MQKYLDACQNQRKLDRKTIKAYRIDLRQFAEFMAGENTDLSRETIKSYISYMNQKYKPRTVKRKIASIRALVTWLIDEQLLAGNPFENLHSRLPEPVILPRVIDRKSVV